MFTYKTEETYPYGSLHKSLKRLQEFRTANSWSILDRFTVDISDGKLILELDAIGLDKDDIEIKLSGYKLTIESNKDIDSEESSLTKNIKYTYTIDDKYDTDTISSELKNGILRITVDKVQDEKPKRIKIK